MTDKQKRKEIRKLKHRIYLYEIGGVTTGTDEYRKNKERLKELENDR